MNIFLRMFLNLNIKYSITGVAAKPGSADIPSEPKSQSDNEPIKNNFNKIKLIARVPNARYGPFSLNNGNPIAKPKITATTALIIIDSHIGKD